MGYNGQVVRYYQNIGTHTTPKFGSYVDLPVYDVETVQNTGNAKDSFEFKLLNTGNNNYSNYFEPTDRIYIYLWSDKNIAPSNLQSSDMVMFGSISTVEESCDNRNGNYILVKGINYSETLFNAYVYLTIKHTTSPSVILSGLNFIKTLDPNYPITFSPATTTTEGKAFKDVSVVWQYKSFNNLLETYSKTEYTGDPYNYYWYVDTNNVLQWKPRKDTSSMTLTEGIDFYDIRKTKDTKDVKNYIIWKAGYNIKNSVVAGYYADYVSLLKNGFKPYILTDIFNMGNDLLNDERINNPTRFTGTNKYPTSYPYTTAWKSTRTDLVNSPNCIAGSSVTTSSNSEWEFAFNRELNWMGDTVARAFLASNAYGKEKITIKMKLNTGFTVGNSIKVVSASLGIGKTYRIQEIRHNVKGTMIIFEEDIASVNK